MAGYFLVRGLLNHRELLIIPCFETDDEGGPCIWH
jgi:hypothetical protein